MLRDTFKKMRLNQQSLAVAASHSYSLVRLTPDAYVNLEATGSYPDGTYTSGGLEAVVGYETLVESVGMFLVIPTVTHTDLLTSSVM